ncbi:hypothetical protein, partial [Streptomyces sp. NRRL S-481]|uniref:hypothetical protein n=1 Tax=Streptomyces sp. NRRL S-481 TaxID=1463911 RepID=UPI003B63B23A
AVCLASPLRDVYKRQWWETDGRTDLALLHLESFGNPRAFSRTARRVTRRMPILTVDAGRTEAGRR